MWNIKHRSAFELIRNSELVTEPENDADNNGQESFNNDKNLTVVSVIGSNHFNNIYDGSPKDTFRRPFKFCIDAFGNVTLFKSEVPSSDSNRQTDPPVIDGFYNTDESVLFLHLNDSYDSNLIGEACEEVNSVVLEKEFIEPFNAFRSKHCQTLLLLFSLSHFIVLSSSFDYLETRFIHLFKTLDAVRIKTRPFISKLLQELDIPKQWIEHGRLCCPKMLFFFEIESKDELTPLKYLNMLQPEKPVKCLKDYQTKLEEDVYLVLRKCRIITNTSSSSLVDILDDRDFVFVYDKYTPDAGRETNASTYATYIQQFCSSLSTMRQANLPTSASLNATSKLMFSKAEGPSQQYFRTSFSEFLLGNVKHIKRKMTDSEASRRNRPFFIQPSLKQWKSAYASLYSYLVLGQHSDQRATEAYSGIEIFVNVDFDYLEGQCAKMFPKMLARYQKNLPDVYGEEEHNTRLTQAINAYLNTSRGATIVPWLEKLAAKCEQYWKNGHQQCPAMSLHEHPCVLPVHRVPLDSHLEILPFPFVHDPELEELSHTSQITVKSSCNCGRLQLVRDEPFTIKEANYSFYKKAEAGCCDKLEHHKFPEYVPQDETPDISFLDMFSILQDKFKAMQVAGGQQPEEDEYELNASQELRRGNVARQVEEDEEEEVYSAGVDEVNVMQEDALSQAEVPMELTLQDLEEPLVVGGEKEEPFIDEERREENSIARAEYLPGMVHSKSPRGLLPLYPSFSLVCLGSSSIYAHSTGVTYQPGFLSGFMHLLLPLDVKVKAEAGVLKPLPRSYRGTKMYGQMKRLADEFSVKLFIGVEFECRKGHRFFLQSPDKVLMISNSVERVPNLKESASKIANSDIPLYYKCPCSAREGRVSIGQLIRVHIVTPKAPVHVSINPRVMPAPFPCPIFHPGNSEPLKLRPSSYWILRLPYSYVGDDKCYAVPQDPSTYNGRLLRGFYEVVAMSKSETEQWEAAQAANK